MWDSSFAGALTPKFYVALTGTSSLISGLILIFEWWYFRKYGTSFIEQISLAHLGPWFGGGGASAGVAGEEGAAGGDAGAGNGAGGVGGDCLVRRNPMALLRGAEYARLWTMARRAPLTYYDMNLTAQEHQAWFGCVGDGPAEEALGRAWREREPRARVAAAREALRHAPDCAAALLLLAEEDAPTVVEAERVLRRAWRAAEAGLRAGGAAGGAGGGVRARDAAVLAHVKRRAAACYRRLGRLREAARLYRELAREGGAGGGSGESLLEVLLEQRAYADAQAALARLEEGSVWAAYTRALLQARAAAEEEVGGAGSSGEDAAEALRAALACNAHVPAYLLELRALALPPEHVVRGGRSEALAYAFFHLRHWRACPPALRLLEVAWRETGAGSGAAALEAGCADRELVAGGAEAGDGGVGLRCASAGAGVGLLAAALGALVALGAWRWPALALRLDPRRALAALGLDAAPAPDPINQDV